MLLREMHKMFDIIMDKVSSEALPEISTVEKDEFINNAIDSFTKTRYGKNNMYKAGFEEIQKRTDDLRSLVRTAFPELTEVLYEDDTYKANLDSLFLDEEKTTLAEYKYWFYLKSTTLVQDLICKDVYQENKLVQQDDLVRVLQDPFNKPSKNRVIIYFEENGIYIKCDKSNTIDNFKLTFLKQPDIVSVNKLDSTGNSDIQCDLPEHTHREIVKFAVKEALEAIESPRQQTYINNLNSLE